MGGYNTADTVLRDWVMGHEMDHALRHEIILDIIRTYRCVHYQAFYSTVLVFCRCSAIKLVEL